MFAGREATPAEIDDLAAELLDKVTEVAIVAEERHEISAHSEAALHQVRIEVSGDELPDDEHELDEMRGRLVETADRWARACIAGRSVEIGEPERFSRLSSAEALGLTMTLRTLPLMTAAVLLLAACGGGSDSSSPELPQGSEAVELDAADFTTEIDNPYWPMSPGSRWVYRETDGRGEVQRVEVTVTSRTKTIDGIEARVVHDLVTTPDGEKVEDTFDWYAQDSKGNLWYLGEDTKEYENGKVSLDRGLLGARRRRSPGGDHRSRGAEAGARPTARSTTPVTPRTPPKCLASTARCRCRAGCSGTR